MVDKGVDNAYTNQSYILNLVLDKFKTIEVISLSLLINAVNFHYEIYMSEGLYYIIPRIREGRTKVSTLWKDLNTLFKGLVTLTCYRWTLEITRHSFLKRMKLSISKNRS